MRNVIDRLTLRFLTQAIAVHMLSLMVVLLLGGFWLASKEGSRRLEDLPSELHLAADLGARHELDEEEVSRRFSSPASCPALTSLDVARLLERWTTRAPGGPEVERLVTELQALEICSIAEAEAVLSSDDRMSAVDSVYRALVGRPPDVRARLTYGQWLARGIPLEIVARDVLVSPEFRTMRSLGER